MKAKKGFELRCVAGEHILVATGADNVDFSKMISMNRSAAYLWKEVEVAEFFSAEMLATLLLQRYEVDADTAATDSEHIMKEWLDAGIIEE